jgi:putative ABC transport system ATP-binding protein
MIYLDNVTKIFHESTPRAYVALENISLSIPAKSLVVLHGVSGSGKSTLLSLIGALTKPSSGTLLIDEAPIAKLPDSHASTFRTNHIGFIFQSFNLFEELTVYDNIMLACSQTKVNASSLHDRVNWVMEKANIAHKATQTIKHLSGGEKQRCAIARALVNDPDIILCDEPTANLDHSNTEQFIATMEQLKHQGKTIIIATHDPRFENLPSADQHLYIDQGRMQS